MRICLMLLAMTGISLPPAVAATMPPWPTEAVRVVVPYGAGSATDIVPRVVLEQLAQQLGQPVVVENRPGAGGTVGAGFVANAKPDGYTLLVNSSAHTVAPALYHQLSYDPARDFASVIPLGISPNVLVVSPGKGFKTVGDLVKAAGAKPQELTLASVGVGSATYLSGERFCLSAGVKAVHVPFNGGAEAMAEVMAGRVDFFSARSASSCRWCRRASLPHSSLAVPSAPRRCRTCRRRVRPASSMPSIRSGSVYSLPQRLRRRCSTPCTIRSSERCKSIRCGTSCPRLASIRW